MPRRPADMPRAEGQVIEHAQPENWSLSDWGVRDQESYDRLHHDAFVRGSGYETMQPIPGAVEGIRNMNESSLLTRIVTGRLWNSQVVVPALSGTACWLAKSEIPVDDVVFVSGKTAIEANIYIEDAPHFLRDLQAADRDVIIMDARYNRHLPGPRASSCDHTPDLVANLLAKQSNMARSHSPHEVCE